MEWGFYGYYVLGRKSSPGFDLGPSCVCAWSLNMTGAWRLIRYEVEFFGAERQVGTVDSWYGSEH